jgi:hypothetical protein
LTRAKAEAAALRRGRQPDARVYLTADSLRRLRPPGAALAVPEAPPPFAAALGSAAVTLEGVL